MFLFVTLSLTISLMAIVFVVLAAFLDVAMFRHPQRDVAKRSRLHVEFRQRPEPNRLSDSSLLINASI